MDRILNENIRKNQRYNLQEHQPNSLSRTDLIVRK